MKKKQWELQVPLMMVCWEKIHEKGEHEAPLSTLFTTQKREFRTPPVMVPPRIFLKSDVRKLPHPPYLQLKLGVTTRNHDLCD
jgi:hypothetical protein